MIPVQNKLTEYGLFSKYDKNRLFIQLLCTKPNQTVESPHRKYAAAEYELADHDFREYSYYGIRNKRRQYTNY